MQGTPFLGQKDPLEEEMAPFRRGLRCPLPRRPGSNTQGRAAWVGPARVGLGGGRTCEHLAKNIRHGTRIASCAPLAVLQKVPGTTAAVNIV